MVYIKNDTIYVEFPKHIESQEETYNLKLINNSTRQISYYTNLIDVSESDALYKFEIVVGELPEGEYSYQIYTMKYDEEIHASYEFVWEAGLLINGDYVAEVREFENENNLVEFNG